MLSSDPDYGWQLYALQPEDCQGGSIATDDQGILTVTPGVYTVTLDVGVLSASLALNLQATGKALQGYQYRASDWRSIREIRRLP